MICRSSLRVLVTDITTALTVLEPFGIFGGKSNLGVVGLISKGITEYDADAIFSGS